MTWTKKSYDAIYDWLDTTKRASARQILLTDGLDDVVRRLDEAKNILGVWCRITREAENAVGDAVEQSSLEAKAEREREKFWNTAIKLFKED